jgi:hypothetical protein
MSRSQHDEIFALICDCCDVKYLGRDPEKRHPQNYQLSRDSYQRLNGQIAEMHGAAYCWTKPSKIEAEVEDARRKLSDAIAAIKAIDGYAKALARQEASRDRDAAFHAQIIEVGQREISNDEKITLMNEICAAHQPQPVAEWVDYSVIAAMEKLRNALAYPVKLAIPNASTGRGRPANRRAYRVADCAYRIFSDLTGEKPTFWNGGETAFSRLVTGLFAIYGIHSTLRKPIEAAMHKYSDPA